MSLRHPSAAPRTCRLFWCYQCHRAVRLICSPSSDILCPRCYGRFLHEIDLPRPRLVIEFTPVHPFPPQQPHHFHHHPLFPPPNRRGYSDLDRLPRLNSNDPTARGGHPPPYLVSLPRPVHPNPRRPPTTVPVARPEDFYTGPNLNELIEDLTQNDRPGPPPAPSTAISALPTVNIADAHLTDGSQCPVCKEEFSLGEEAKQMPCKHVYHSDCIVPWLNLHNSCPVCRFQLPGGRQQENNATAAGANRGASSHPGGRWNWNTFFTLWPFGEQPSRAGNFPYRRRDENDNNTSNDFTVLPAFFLVSLCFLFFSFFL
ncbi:probable E3 ubiquitin-protein ligase RHC1A [Zingiber officinale]|uniref:probable E3 ubiquitin-protein ligase RHC1A n=1 Tax=Zingiber officinale TaxID=94328 RepID=UPI001C4B97C1|nr:probable E3 ubiquitin-protein ligase RHC1A [Zingiber officinale]